MFWKKVVARNKGEIKGPENRDLEHKLAGINIALK